MPNHLFACTCRGKFYGAQPFSCPAAQQFQLRRAQVQKRGNFLVFSHKYSHLPFIKKARSFWKILENVMIYNVEF